jgi:hypothetical protein
MLDKTKSGIEGGRRIVGAVRAVPRKNPAMARGGFFVLARPWKNLD